MSRRDRHRSKLGLGDLAKALEAPKPVKRPCDVCGNLTAAQPLTDADRRELSSLARWIKLVCPTCRSGYSKKREKRKAAKA